MDRSAREAENFHISASGWERALASASPATLLIAIELKMSAGLRERVSAEDVMQESLLHAWRDRASHVWSGPRAFRNWLLSIADHRIADAADHAWALKRGGGRVASPLGPGENEPFTSTTPSRIAWCREQASAIRAAVDSLPEDLRPVVRMRLVEQRGIGEIAEELGLSATGVRHRLRRGAEAFRSRLMASLGTRYGSRMPEDAGTGMAQQGTDASTGVERPAHERLGLGSSGS